VVFEGMLTPVLDVPLLDALQFVEGHRGFSIRHLMLADECKPRVR
jgi:hypothetical protein